MIPTFHIQDHHILRTPAKPSRAHLRMFAGVAFVLLTVLVLSNHAAAQARKQAPKEEPNKTSSEKLSSPRPGSVVKAQFGDWKHECAKPPGAAKELCALTQDVTDESNSDIGLSVHVQKLPAGERILRVVAPLGVLLTHNLAVKVDGKYLGEAPFSRCYVVGCQAQIDIDAKLAKHLSTGKTALLIIHRTQEQGIGIPISLRGFGKGLAALK